MALGDRIKEARIKNGFTQEQLANMIGSAKSTITGYEKGNRIPPAAVVGAIADATNVDANFLYQDEVRERKENSVSLEELSIIKKYRSLDDTGRHRIDYELDAELTRVRELQQKELHIQTLESGQSSTRILAYYGKIAAAGKSFGFDDITAGTIECPLSDMSLDADFAIGVNGDSMEPTFFDGDIVYVKKNIELDVGDIGIFQKDDGIYIKEVGSDGLISHNGRYKPMINGGTVLCLGKVLGKV